MRMLLTVLLPCALFSTGAMAEPFLDIERAPPMFYWDCAELHGAAQQYCVAVEITRAAPCKGSVEERLNCLESKIAERDDELRRLRWEIERSRRPRVHPLDGRLSLEQ